MDEEQLKNLTDQLLHYCHEASSNFQRTRESGAEGDFYGEVKPFADQVKKLCEKWEPLAVKWTIARKPKKIFPQQIKNTAENIQMVSVRSFYPDSSLKRFKSHIQSVEYVLNRIVEEINKNKSR
ncbi:YppE family protein [Siminovitchia sp. 179-K 8D1 HS]|uniref:YppE family protein n=1 Tax=Siminovitchia sp. 179-K 8D1 HS TaxID=3142385 RepID=UPI0039A3587B